MIKYIISLFLVLFYINVYAQDSIDFECIQGIYLEGNHYSNFVINKDQNKNYSRYYFIENENILLLKVDSLTDEVIILTEGTIGFLKQFSEEGVSIAVKDIGESDTKEIVECWGGECGYIEIFCDESELTIVSGSNDRTYTRFDSDLSYKIYNSLYLSDHYRNKVLGEKYKSPCEFRLDVFNEIDGIKVGYLIEGDLVEVLETQGEWSKIKY